MTDERVNLAAQSTPEPSATEITCCGGTVNVHILNTCTRKTRRAERPFTVVAPKYAFAVVWFVLDNVM